MAFTLRAVAGAMELLAGFAANLSAMLMFGYDMLVIVPLRLEELLTRKSARGQPAHADQQGG
jgi:hypothetical protein